MEERIHINWGSKQFDSFFLVPKVFRTNIITVYNGTSRSLNYILRDNHFSLPTMTTQMRASQ